MDAHNELTAQERAVLRALLSYIDDARDVEAQENAATEESWHP